MSRKLRRENTAAQIRSSLAKGLRQKAGDCRIDDHLAPVPQGIRVPNFR
jgi:hypothetical protein